MSYNDILQNKNSRLSSILDTINNLPEAGTDLPELTNEGAAADLLSGKQLINSEGEVVTGTIATKTSSDLTASGATITVPAGYYSSNASKSVTAVAQAIPSITVNENGLITASATQTAGYVAAGTRSGTKQLTTQAARTIMPSTSNQTIAAGTYCSGAQVIVGDINFIEANIKSGITLFGKTGTHIGASYPSAEEATF